MKFSIIVPWYGKSTERLLLFNRTTASALQQTLPRGNYELILVKDQEALTSTFEAVADKVIVMPHRPLFNKSWFINTAARQVSHDWFFLLDADLLLDGGHLQAISEYTDSATTYVFIPFSECKWMLEEGSNRIVDYTKLDIFGLGFCIRKHEFFKTGGMCENFDGYGGEDGDIYERHKGYTKHMKYMVTHQYHNHPEQIDFKWNQDLVKICRKNQKEIKERMISIKDQIGNALEPTLINYKDLL